jgi:hypothetical protein
VQSTLEVATAPASATENNPNDLDLDLMLSWFKETVDNSDDSCFCGLMKDIGQSEFQRVLTHRDKNGETLEDYIGQAEKLSECSHVLHTKYLQPAHIKDTDPVYLERTKSYLAILVIGHTVNTFRKHHAI